MTELTKKEDDQLFDLLQNYLNNVSPKERRLIKAEITVLISTAMQRVVDEVRLEEAQQHQKAIEAAYYAISNMRAEVELVKGFAQHKVRCDMILKCSGCNNYFVEHEEPFTECPPMSNIKRTCTCGLDSPPVNG